MRCHILSRLVGYPAALRLTHAPRRIGVACIVGGVLLGGAVRPGASASGPSSPLRGRPGPEGATVLAAWRAGRTPADTVTDDTTWYAGDPDHKNGSTKLRIPKVRWTRWDSTGWRGRVVIGEYDTGIFCVPCWYHDRAFEALRHRYPATAFLGLAYYDLLSPPINSLYTMVKLVSWYGVPRQDCKVDGVIARENQAPGKISPYINGHATEDTSANSLDAKQRVSLGQRAYDEMVPAIDAVLAQAPEATLQVQVIPHEGTIATRVTVTSLAPGHPLVFVRILLVEDPVHLHMAGHHGWLRSDYPMVVRMAAGGGTDATMGTPLIGPGAVNYTFDVAELQRRNLMWSKKDLWDIWDKDLYETLMSVFPDPQDWRIDPTRLSVVAFVQDPTGNILQAQKVSVLPGPHDAQLQLP